MPRANRTFVPGHVWHLTHRCHKKEFLLKFATDKKRWLYWLWQAKKRYGLQVLNYIVTSNHIHLLVSDSKKPSIIPDAMQLVAGRTAQEYNKRKNRKGSFWQDRYHATIIDSGSYFKECMAYIDLNMVRAGVVSHPLDWPYSGYYDCFHPRYRYLIIDYACLLRLLHLSTIKELKKSRDEWIEDASKREGALQRNDKWTESIAVGDLTFLGKIKKKLESRAFGRSIYEFSDGWRLKEDSIAYSQKTSQKIVNKGK